MRSKFQFWYERLRDKLWIWPLIFCLLVISAALAARTADRLGINDLIPQIDHGTVEKLLSIIAASMLGVATFAVGSMVSAYASVSSTATPRATALVIAYDVSKTVLSTFIAAFIFSVVSLVAIMIGYYGPTGLFIIFIMTIAVLGWVVFSFVRWVDQIARLGRVGTTIARVETAAKAAIERRRHSPTLGALPIETGSDLGEPIYADTIGYIQHINVEALQFYAEKHKFLLTVAALPGGFIAPGRALAFLQVQANDIPKEFDRSLISRQFVIGHDRTYEEDPRFGLIALSEIASRALSPAVNDPGTAIDIIGTLVRLFTFWVLPLEDTEDPKQKFDRVRVPALKLEDMFDDAFRAIARDGAGTIEVVVKLQKAFISLSSIHNGELREAAVKHSKLALARAELALKLPYEIEHVRALANKVLYARSQP